MVLGITKLRLESNIKLEKPRREKYMKKRLVFLLIYDGFTFLHLGERSIFSLLENGMLGFMKKFEYSPSCFLPYGSCK